MTRIIHFHFKAKHNVGDAAVVLAIRQLVEAELGEVRWTSQNLNDLKSPPTPRLSKKISRHDLMILGGGGFYSEHGLPLDARAVQSIDIPLVLFGLGYNENLGADALSPEQLDSIRLLNERASLSGVRDEASHALLQSLGIESVNTGDPALFLRSQRTRFRLDGRHRIGINIACHGWRLQARYLDSLVDLYIEALRQLRASMELQPVYMVHTSKELPIARRLSRAVPDLKICKRPPAELLSVYEQLDLVISMMLHSSILSLAAGKPVINIAYDVKNRSFMQDIGHPERCHSLDSLSPDEIVRQATYLLQSETPGEELLVRERWRLSTRRFVSSMVNLRR